MNGAIKIVSEKDKFTIDNRSVVFIFNSNEKNPIAVSLDYLYYGEDYYTELLPQMNEVTMYPLQDEDGNETDNRYQIVNNYDYIDRINEDILEYGLRKHYYKNKNGVWVDINKVKHNVKLFKGLVIPGLNNSKYQYEYYIYADNVDMIDEEFRSLLLANVNEIPQINFIDNTGTHFLIRSSDGINNINVDSNGDIVYSENRDKNIYSPRIYFNNSYSVIENKNIVNSPRFKIELYNYSLKLTNDMTNTYLLDDLKITFINDDGTDYCTHEGECDCEVSNKNLLVTIFGLTFDYIPDPDNKNVIYILDVVKFASFQQTRSVNLSADRSRYIKDVHYNQSVCHYLAIPSDNSKYCYDFDINIRKWDGVNISNFISPINTIKTPKYESITDDTYYLTTGLVFNIDIDYDKFIMIRDGEIIPKYEYYIDPIDNHIVHFKFVSDEFDKLMKEIRTELDEYTEQMVELENTDVDYGSFPREADFENLDDYLDALNDYISLYGYDFKSQLSALAIVREQYNNIKYSIISVESSRFSEDIMLYENTIDIKLDTPYDNQFMVDGYYLGDMYIFNGLNRKIVNVKDSIFAIPDMDYNFTINYRNKLKNGNVYRLDFLKLRRV